MTGLQLFAFFGLPIVIVALASVVFFLEGRNLRPRRPAPYVDKHVRTPGE